MLDQITKTFSGLTKRFASLDKRLRIAILIACIVLIAGIGYSVMTSPSPKGTWYANGLMKAVTLNPDKSADIDYLIDPDSPNLHGIVLADSATWEQDGEKVEIHYKEKHESTSKTDYTVYLIYGKDSAGDEFLKNLRTGDVMYRTGSICESKDL